MAAAILILTIALAIVVLYLSRITKRLHPNLDLKNVSNQENINLLDEARAKAINIIDEANNRALDIVGKVTLSTDAASEDFKKDLRHISSTQIGEFEKATTDFTKIYSQTLQDLKIKNIEVFQNVSKDIEINTMEEIKNFKESMQKLTTSYQEEVRKKIDIDYEAAKKEVEVYRKEELEKIDSGIYEFLGKLSKLVLGKAISLSDHEDLIEKSLEKAKKEGVFR